MGGAHCALRSHTIVVRRGYIRALSQLLVSRRAHQNIFQHSEMMSFMISMMSIMHTASSSLSQAVSSFTISLSFPNAIVLYTYFPCMYMHMCNQGLMYMHMCNQGLMCMVSMLLHFVYIHVHVYIHTYSCSMCTYDINIQH